MSLFLGIWQIIYVAAGGAIGAVLRYLAVQFAVQLNPGSFPAGTMIVNSIGSFIIGMFMARYAQFPNLQGQLFFVTGILGGFTTFSAFSWDTLQLLQRGEGVQALLYVAGSVFMSLAAVAVGFLVGK